MSINHFLCLLMSKSRDVNYFVAIFQAIYLSVLPVFNDLRFSLATRFFSQCKSSICTQTLPPVQILLSRSTPSVSILSVTEVLTCAITGEG